MNVIGIDFGTTTVCAVVIDSDSGAVLKSVTAKNDSFIQSVNPYERLQSPKRIAEIAFDIIDGLIADFAPIGCIGISGQMHGIVYIDKNGESVSNLYTWQDSSGNESFDGKVSYASHLTSLTGHKAASGFGGTTFFCHSVQKKVPENAVKICAISDYIALKLTGRTSPLVHTSIAASFGLFDIKKMCFDKDAANKAGLDFGFFPDVVSDFTIAGEYKNIPVCVGVGDNQASFLGSVDDMENTVLINMGTGGQISYFTSVPEHDKLEIRPCFSDKYIAVGCSLCGGRAFQLMGEFISQTAELVTGSKPDNVYRSIDAFLSGGYKPKNPLKVSTLFAGTREDPDERGSICNIGTDNFTPYDLIIGVMDGMVDELVSMYGLPAGTHKSLVGSGNGLRKNAALRKKFSDYFGLEMKIPSYSEEASFGAALAAMVASGMKKDFEQAQKLIKFDII